VVEGRRFCGQWKSGDLPIISKAPQTFFFSHKLKALKADLKFWNEQCLAIWRTRKKNLLGELIVIDGLEKEGVLHDKEKQRKDCYW
jgi:hypothetical protein